jgi:pimeloyl-ACP methyl ester carboxylesterase
MQVQVERQSFQSDDGERLHVAVVGEGPPLIFLHGWTTNHQEWLPYAKHLADIRQVYCWDARGHGGHSLLTAYPPTLERMARDLHQLITHFRLQQPTLVGHSMGALTVWEYLRQFGCDHLARLCLIDQSPKLLTDDDWRLGIYGNFPAERNAEFIDELRNDFAEALLRLGANGCNKRFTANYQCNSDGIKALRQYLKTLEPEPLIRCWESLSQADYRDVLPQIAVPTLLIYGGESTFYSQATAEYVRDRIPQATLKIYEGLDHSPHLWNPRQFVDDLRDFVSASDFD